jgi:ATP:ADP antiporter, AAA family
MSWVRSQFDSKTLAKSALLFAYLFLIIAAYVIGKVARDALFLEQFKAIKLPFADIAIAVLVGFVVAGYVRLGQKLSLRRLVTTSLVTYAVIFGAFWYLARFQRFEWLFPALYIFIGIFGVLATAQVWTLGSYVLTTREAKRAFGIVGGGAIAGNIFGGFTSKHVARAFGTIDLLLVIAACMLICIAIVNALWAHRLEQQSESNPALEEFSILRSMQEVAKSPHLRGIATLICLSSFVTTIAAWQFKAMAQQNILSTDNLASFFGDFNFYAGFAGLAAQLLLTGPLLRWLGVTPTLMVLPVTLVLGHVGVLVFGTLLAVSVLRGFDQVLRYSVDKSSVELLYLPVPSNIKVQTKSFVDTVVWRFGDGLAGILVLLCVGTLGLATVQMSWISLVLIVIWLVAAWSTKASYVELLREGVSTYRMEAEKHSAEYLDASTVRVFEEKLRSPDPQDVVYGLRLIEMDPHTSNLQSVRDLLKHPSGDVRRRAISVLTTAHDAAAEPTIRKMLDDPDPKVTVESRLYLISRGREVPAVPESICAKCPSDMQEDLRRITELARSNSRSSVTEASALLERTIHAVRDSEMITRTAVARLISVLPDRFDRQLSALLYDRDDSVVKEAIRAAGRLRSRKVLPAVIEMMASEKHGDLAVRAAVRYGDIGVGTLRDSLHDRREDPVIRKAVALALGKVATRKAARSLEEALIEDNVDVRDQVIRGLNEIQSRQANVIFNTQPLEAALAAEIADHYASYVTLEPIGEVLDGAPSAVVGIQAGMDKELERIFGLLNLLYPKYDLLSVHFGVLSPVPGVSDNSLEMLETILNPNVRGLLLPLLDSKVSPTERARLALETFGKLSHTRLQIAGAFIKSGNAWLRAAGAYIFAALEECDCMDELLSKLNDSDPLVRGSVEFARDRIVATGHHLVATKPSG